MRRNKILVGAAALAAAATIANAVPADATPTQDGAFLYALGEAGISYGSADAAIEGGRAVCRALDEGFTPTEVANEIHQRKRLPAAAAVDFTVAAIAAYCPWRIPAEPGGTTV